MNTLNYTSAQKEGTITSDKNLSSWFSFAIETKKNYPNVMKNLSYKTRNKAIQIANTILRIGKLKEGKRVAIALSKAKETIAEYNKKRINNVKVYTI